MAPQTQPVTLYISHLSPYSLKAWALLSWAGVPVDVRVQNILTRYTVLQRLTGKTMVPVLRQGSWAINDSTRIARWATGRAARPLLPDDPALAALAWLLEDFADEWGARWFVYSRWHDPDSDVSAIARAIGEELFLRVPGLSETGGQWVARLIQGQVARGGAEPANAAALEGARDRTLALLEHLLADGGFLFGPWPTLLDFAWYGPILQLRRDAPHVYNAETLPAVARWLDQIDALRTGRFVPLDVNAPWRAPAALAPLVEELLCSYWKLLCANRAALASGAAPGPVAIRCGEEGVTFTLPRASRYLDERLAVCMSAVEQFLKHSEGRHEPGWATLRALLETAREEAPAPLS